MHEMTEMINANRELIIIHELLNRLHFPEAREASALVGQAIDIINNGKGGAYGNN